MTQFDRFINRLFVIQEALNNECEMYFIIRKKFAYTYGEIEGKLQLIEGFVNDKYYFYN